MNIPKYSLENRKVIYFFLAILLIGGVISFFKLPKNCLLYTSDAADD